MQKIFLRLLLLLLALAPMPAQAAATAPTAPTKGVVRVKLQPEAARKLGAAPLRKAPGANLATGMTPFDKSARSIKAFSIERMFPYAPKFEAEYRKFGLDRWYEIRFDETVDAAEARRVMQLTAGIEKAENIVPMKRMDGGSDKVRVLDGPVKAAAQSPSGFNDPRLPLQWHYYNDGSVSGSVKGADINLFNAWKTTTGSPDVIVAIIDGGIDVDHEDLAQNMLVNLAELNGTPGVDDDGNGYVDDIYGYNFVTNSADIYPHNHGTHVAGTVAAVNNNGIGVGGVAGGDGTPGSGIRMFSAQVFDPRSGTGGEGDFAKAIVYSANRGASIAQCSWGWDSDGYYEQAVLDAIDYFTEATAGRDKMLGGLCIFASGNQGVTGNIYPACYDKVLAVASMTNDLAPASYSNYGEWVDVIAPGGLLDYGEAGGVLSTLPDNKYGYMEGTSMACPHVSGIAALILSKYGNATFPVSTLRTQIETSVRDFYSQGNNSRYEGLYGSGYVDAERALMMGDGTAPEAVSDLKAYASQDNITLRWTIPASSDGNVNQHVLYYSTSAFDASSLASAKSVAIDSKFLASGDPMEYVLEGLNAETTYYLAIAAVNRWGDASPLSEVVTATTNAGPKMTLDETADVSFAVLPTSIGSATFSIGNEADGLLRWSSFRRTVPVRTGFFSTPRPLNTVSFKGKLGGTKIKAPAKVYTDPDTYQASDYPKSLACFEEVAAFIGVEDRALPNSMAQWFKVDADKYPDGFNLTHIRISGENGTDALQSIQILKGEGSLTTASVIEEFRPDFFYYGGDMALPEQLFFQPGESFWIAVHFNPITDEVYQPYPLGLAFSNAGDVSHNCYMSNDLGKTWSRLDEALKGSPYESMTSEYTWAIDPKSQNPDWSELLVLTPSEGTVVKGETQEVKVTSSTSKLINGTYKFNIGFKTNETADNTLRQAVTMTVSGNKAEMQVPRIVDFGSLLVGETKKLTVEIYNKGYGDFRGSQYSAGIYSDKISVSSENFAGPDYVSAGFPARAKATVELTYQPKTAGDHTGTVTFTDKDGDTFRITMRGVATDPAKIEVTPATVDAGDLDIDADPVTMSFKIANKGRYPLEFVMPRFSDQTIEGSASKTHKFGYTIHTNIGETPDFEYDNNPDLIAATDLTKQFVTGTYSEPIDLGFDFPYFGQKFDKVYVNNHGGVQFSISENQFFPPLTPTANGVPGTGMISAYGRDLVMGPDSKVECARLDGKFVVRYSNVLALVYDKDYTPISFHLTLSGNGDVEIFFDSYDPFMVFQSGTGLFVGLCDPSDEDPIVYTSADITNPYAEEQTPEMLRYTQVTSGSAFRFEAPKPNFIRAVEPAYGLLNPGEEVNVNATLKADDTMFAGASFNNLVILSNDPQQGTSFVRFDANITGESLKPELSVPETMDFGKVFRTSDTRVALSVKNTGSADLQLTSATSKNGVYTVSTELPVTVAPGMSKDVIVVVPTAASQDLSDVVEVVTSAGSAETTVKGTVIGVPAATLSYESIEETTASGTAVDCPLTVTNNGNEPLRYSVTPDPMFALTIPEGGESSVSYGYTSSVDDESLPKDWIDITQEEGVLHNDLPYYMEHDYIEVELPFAFPFYGKTYTKMYVYNTGFVSFTKRNDDKIWPEPPASFPGGTLYTNIIAPFWGLHSMDETRTAGTYYKAYADKAVVSFIEYGNSMNVGVNFQLILNPDGSFRFQYSPRDEVSIIFDTYGLAGVLNEAGTDGFVIPERYIQFGQSVYFSPVTERTLAPGESETVGVSLLADKMAGLYETTMTVNTNVPSRERIEIPVSLTVTGEAAPAWPEDMAVEHVMGFVETANPGPMGMMGAMYEVEFQVKNEGTAPFYIMNIVNGGPGNTYYDEWFDEEVTEPFFPLMCTEDPSDMMSWMPYQTGMPFEVDSKPVYFDVPMMNYELAMTPGVYEVPLTFYYMTSMDSDELLEKVVTVKFTVTPPPAMELDRQEINVVAPTDDYTTDEVLTISNEYGDYKLEYELRLDPTGVGEEAPNPGGDPGIDPLALSKARSLAPASFVKPDSLAAARMKSVIRPFDVGTTTNSLDQPQDMDLLRTLYYPSVANSNVYNYGTGNKTEAFIGATYFVAPEGGFNISHIYVPLLSGELTHPELKIEIVKGDSPAGDQILGSAHVMFEVEPSPYTLFYTIPLNKPVFVDSGEDFFVRITYPVGVETPALLVPKQDAVKEAVYAAYIEGIGYNDIAMGLADQLGSVGWAVSCIETSVGEPWVSLPEGQPLKGTVEAGEKAEVKVHFSAASAPLEKGNRAVLVIKSNDPNMPVYNLPLTLDRNGTPVISTESNIHLAKEGETSELVFTVSDPDGDDMQILFDDPAGISKVKAVEPDAADTDAEVSYNEELNVYTLIGIKGAVTVKVEVAPEFGQASDDIYPLMLSAADRQRHATSLTVNCVVEHVNRAPAAAEESKKIVLTKGSASEVVNFADLFTDADSDPLTYKFEMAESNVATAFTTKDGVIFYGDNTGSATATVTATDPSGATAVCRLEISVEEQSGISNIGADDRGLVRVMPNPVENDLNAVCSFMASDVRFTLYDASGRTVAAKTCPVANGTTVVIPVASCPAGVYILTVESSEVNASIPVIKK